MVKGSMTVPLRKLLLIVGVLYFFFGISSSYAEGLEKQDSNEPLAIGISAIDNGNLASAKEKAISNALMKGVENYLIHRLGSHGMINNFQRLNSEIIPNAREEIENFHILQEDRTANDYKVLVRLRINEKVMEEKLKEAGLLFMDGPDIKVLFLVSETTAGTISCWWKDPEINSALSPTELTLYNVFEKRGFSPINRILSIPETEYSSYLRSADLLDEQILEWGRLFSADIVMYGKTEVLENGDISLGLKAFDVDQGISICQGMQTEPVMEMFEDREPVIDTLDRLVNYLAARLTPIIIQDAVVGHDKINDFEITLAGLTSHRQFVVFRDFLKNDVSGVQSVKQTRISKNSISMGVEFQGERNRFLDSVLKHDKVPLFLALEETGEGGILFKIK
ncbi:MAG: hypothetical protein GY864_01090 [Desulfobacterales bacterium]|nr:hypothetical protein [Desulfobacterales bacterium]